MINLECESLYQFCPTDAVDVGAYNRANCPQTLPNRIPTPSPEIDHNRALRQLLEDTMGLSDRDRWQETEETGLESTKTVSPIITDTWIQQWIEGRFKKIVTVIGPEIYSRLPNSKITNFATVLTERCEELVKQYRLPSVSSLFEMDQLVHKPKAFYELARDILPTSFKPTIYHYFVRILADKNRLLRHYTLNIDMMERLVQLPEELLVEANGTFHTSHCIDCGLEHSFDFLHEQLFQDQTPRCVRCRSLVRPDVVFVGEMLPSRFYLLSETDFAQCDLLMVMGTQLQATSIIELFDKVSDKCVRVVIVEKDMSSAQVAARISGWQQGEVNTKRDVLWQPRQSDPDEIMWDLAKDLQLLDDLEQLILDTTKSQMSIGRSKESLSKEITVNSSAISTAPIYPDNI